MATIQIKVYKPKKNGMCAISLQLTHNGERKYFKITEIEKRCISRYGSITDKNALAAIKKTLAFYEGKLASMSNLAGSMGADALFDAVFGEARSERRAEEDGSVDFFEWYEEFIEMKRKRPGRTFESYRTSLKNLKRFVGADRLDINLVTKSFLVRYMDWMDANGFGARAKESYMTNHCAVHNAAKRMFNDEELGKVVVRFSPFENIRFKMTKAERDMRKRERGDRVVSASAIKYLYDLPYHPKDSVLNQAKDVFLISFCLCGMNACDLLEMECLDKDGRIDHWRKKTRYRSGESSRIIMPVHDVIRPIVEKYAGKGRLFDFGQRYTGRYAENNFTTALNDGLRRAVRWAVEYYSTLWQESKERTQELLGLPSDIQFGYARHAFATVANECNIPIDNIDQCMCHSIRSVADNEYITKSYSFVRIAINKIVKRTFGV